MITTIRSGWAQYSRHCSILRPFSAPVLDTTSRASSSTNESRRYRHASLSTRAGASYSTAKKDRRQKSGVGVKPTAPAEEDEWITVIGLEIHAQLKTGKKLFSPASTSYGEVPNTNVNLYDAAFPGTLPVLDMHAVRLSLLTALALGCDINSRSTFDRKHYFYHDIPASYQITQHYNPLARNGRLPITKGDNNSPRTFVVGIQQLQIEQDTAKSQTVGDDVLVDLNRAGTGLMEIVTHPDMRTAEEAGAFVRKLQGLLRRVGSADGDMEKGNLRVDVNVSVHKTGTPFGTRCEVKNINSVRFLQAAIESERKRHIHHYLTSPSTPLKQETRGLNELTLQTFSLRSKEEAMDYRYMPDSNLPAVVIDPTYLSKLQSTLPEMPWQVVERLTNTFDIQKRDVETLIGLDEYHFEGVKYFEDVVGGGTVDGATASADRGVAKKAMNWITHELLGQLKKASLSWSSGLIPSSLMRELVLAVNSGEITGTTGKSVIRHLVEGAQSQAQQKLQIDTKQTRIPSENQNGFTKGHVVESAIHDRTAALPETHNPASLDEFLASLGLSTASESASGTGAEKDNELKDLCLKAIVNQPKAVADYKKGNEKVIMRLVGEVMKLSQGAADAVKAKDALQALLRE